MKKKRRFRIEFQMAFDYSGSDGDALKAIERFEDVKVELGEVVARGDILIGDQHHLNDVVTALEQVVSVMRRARASTRNVAD